VTSNPRAANASSNPQTHKQCARCSRRIVCFIELFRPGFERMSVPAMRVPLASAVRSEDSHGPLARGSASASSTELMDEYAYFCYIRIYIHIYIYIYTHIYIYLYSPLKTHPVRLDVALQKAVRVFLRIRNRDSIMPPLLRPACFRGRSTTAVSIVSLFRLPLSASFLPRACRHPRRTREYPTAGNVSLG